jgi:putative copper export protein
VDFDATTLRVFLHVLGASVWVGGQIVLGALVPTLRTMGDDAPRRVARAFNRVAWPFFGLAVATGIWNLMEVDFENSSSSYQVGVMLKLLVVAVSGVSAHLHTTAGDRRALAVWGALSAVGALAALLLGASLATSF